MVIVLLYRVTFQASYNGSHFELGITTYVSMRKMIPEPTNQTKVSLVAPITFEISAQDSRAVRISASGPFFDDPGPPPCAAGSACDGLWDYEGKYYRIYTNKRPRRLLQSLGTFVQARVVFLPKKTTAAVLFFNK